MPQPTTHSYPKNRKSSRKGLAVAQVAEMLGLSTAATRARIKADSILLLDDGSIDPAQFPDYDATDSAQLQGRARWESELSEAKAKQAWLDYHLKAGDLVERAAVAAQWFEILRVTRDRLLAVPDRMAPIVAHMSDMRQCREALLRGQREALDALADDLDALAGRA